MGKSIRIETSFASLNRDTNSIQSAQTVVILVSFLFAWSKRIVLLYLPGIIFAYFFPQRSRWATQEMPCGCNYPGLFLYYCHPEEVASYPDWRLAHFACVAINTTEAPHGST